MNYNHYQFFGLFKFQAGYRKFYLNSPKSYSKKIINTQIGHVLVMSMTNSSLVKDKIVTVMFSIHTFKIN